MKIVNIYDEEFINSEAYLKFKNENNTKGFLKIRAYAGSEAIPISNVKVVISTNIDNYKVIFFEGYTNQSGVIDEISLPAPKLNSDNMEKPSKVTYDILATTDLENKPLLYKAYIYEGICVVQNIVVVPAVRSLSNGR